MKQYLFAALMAAMACVSFVGCDDDEEENDIVNEGGNGTSGAVVFENHFGSIEEDGDKIIYKCIEDYLGNPVMTMQSNVEETYTFEDGKCVSVEQKVGFVPESQAETLYEVRVNLWDKKYDAKPTFDGSIMTGDRTQNSGCVGKTKEEVVALLKEMLLDVFNPNGTEEVIVSLIEGRITSKGDIVYCSKSLDEFAGCKGWINYTEAFVFENDKCVKNVVKVNLTYGFVEDLYESILKNWEENYDEKPTMKDASNGYDIICVKTEKGGCKNKSKEVIINELKSSLNGN